MIIENGVLCCRGCEDTLAFETYCNLGPCQRCSFYLNKERYDKKLHDITMKTVHFCF